MAKRCEYGELVLAKDRASGALVVSFHKGDLRSPAVIRALETELLHLAAHARADRLVLDFRGVKVAPSAIFGLTLQFAVDARKAGKHARVCNLAASIRKAFELLNAKGLVEIMDTLPEATTTPWEKKRSWWPFKRG